MLSSWGRHRKKACLAVKCGQGPSDTCPRWHVVSRPVWRAAPDTHPAFRIQAGLLPCCPFGAFLVLQHTPNLDFSPSTFYWVSPCWVKTAWGRQRKRSTRGRHQKKKGQILFFAAIHLFMWQIKWLSPLHKLLWYIVLLSKSNLIKSTLDLSQKAEKQ